MVDATGSHQCSSRGLRAEHLYWQHNQGELPMRIFVTGASGWIGSAVVPELLSAGHQVVGLARSDESARRLEKAGATVLRGDITKPDVLAQGAVASEGVIHLAFQHDLAFTGNFALSAATDRKA